MELHREAIRYFLTPFPRHLRDMGYVKELKHLASRQKRCRSAWRPHLENSRSTILDAADRCRQFDAVLVVGSGLLFDIPTKELSRRFRRVILADIVHLWQVRRAVHPLGNVHLESVDITGVVKDVHARTPAGRGLEVPVPEPKLFLGDQVDLVVSANLLSQLPVTPNGYVSRRGHDPEPELMRSFSRQLVIRHLDWLASFACNVCLISDLERHYCKEGKTVDRERSLWGVDLPEGGREWYWDLAPRPEMEWDRDIRHLVVGYAEFPKRVWRERRAELCGE